MQQIENLKKQYDDMPGIRCQHHKKQHITHFRNGKDSEEANNLLEPICNRCDQQENAIESFENYRPDNEILNKLEQTSNFIKNLQELFNKLAEVMGQNEKKIRQEILSIKKDQNKKFDDTLQILLNVFKSEAHDQLHENLKKLIPLMDENVENITMKSKIKQPVNPILGQYNQKLDNLENKLKEFLDISDIDTIIDQSKQQQDALIIEQAEAEERNRLEQEAEEQRLQREEEEQLVQAELFQMGIELEEEQRLIDQQLQEQRELQQQREAEIQRQQQKEQEEKRLKEKVEQYQKDIQNLNQKLENLENKVQNDIQQSQGQQQKALFFLIKHKIYLQIIPKM